MERMKKYLACAFGLLLFLGLMKNNAFSAISSVAAYLAQSESELSGKKAVKISTLESDYTNAGPFRSKLIDLNGALARLLQMRGYYSSEFGLYITDNNYVVSSEPEASTDYEVESLTKFYDFLQENGIQMLYVSQPDRYLDDSMFAREFGEESYTNRNTDLFMERLRAAGIPAIDLRDNIVEENRNIYDMFYRTDHHWTTPTGLWASRIIAGAMNEYCGCDIDLSLYDEDKYAFNSWTGCWLGEQGRKVAKTYVGLDDFTEIKPSFETDYTFYPEEGDSFDGTFDNFIDESIYNVKKDVYENRSWHYSYSQIHCVNHKVKKGKVLMLSDSYAYVTEPFLSLGVHEIDPLILRSYKTWEFDLRDYILKNGYDTVIICYAQFMVGAHDDPSSANRRMFTFF